MHSACSSDGSTSCGESTGDGYCDPSSVGSADNCKDTDMSDSELSIHVYMRQRTVFSGVFVVGEEVKGEKDDGEEREG